jgi:Sporulation and spore germination
MTTQRPPMGMIFGLFGGRRSLTKGKPIGTLSVIVIICVLSGCGVPAQSSADAIPNNQVPVAIIKPKREVRLFYLFSGTQAPVSRQILLTPNLQQSAEQVLELLRSEFRPTEKKRGLVSLVSFKNNPEYKLRIIDVQNEVVYVDITGSARVEDDPDALSQIVLSLTSIRGIKFVDFWRDEESIGTVRLAGEGGVPTPVELPISAAKFPALDKEEIRLYFAVGDRLELAPKIVSRNKIDDTDPLSVANRFLTETVLGPEDSPSDFMASVNEITQSPSDDQLSANNFQLRVSKAYDSLKPKEQALLLGSVLLSVQLNANRSALPNIEFYVNDTRRFSAPDADGVVRQISFLKPSVYLPLVQANEETETDPVSTPTDASGDSLASATDVLSPDTTSSDVSNSVSVDTFSTSTG